jgi:hypothetical protein
LRALLVTEEMTMRDHTGRLEVKHAFELGYLAAAARLRRELPPAWRAGVLNALTRDAMDREDPPEAASADLRYAPRVRGLRLIVMRCEAAATMLTWHKQLPEKQREQLREAIGKLAAEAARLGVS